MASPGGPLADGALMLRRASVLAQVEETEVNRVLLAAASPRSC